MSQPYICDTCDERIHTGERRWHVEFDYIAYTSRGFESMPLDFCSRDCLRRWATDPAKATV